VLIQFQIEKEVHCEPSPQILIISTSGKINHTSSQLRVPENSTLSIMRPAQHREPGFQTLLDIRNKRMITAQDVVLFRKSFLKKSFD